MLEQIESLIVIAGCQRSGTTLCGQILGAQSECLLIDEPDGLYGWFAQTVDGKLNKGHALLKLLNRANQKYKPDHKRTNGSGVAVTLKPEIRYLVLKAPNLTYDYERLAALDIDVKVIFPVRDPKAVVASMMGLDYIVKMDERQADWANKYSKISKQYEILIDRIQTETEQHIRLALVWKLKTSLLEAFKQSGLNPFVFKYEDLVANKDQYTRDMFEYAGLKTISGSSTYTKIFQGRGPGLTERERPIDKRSLEKWRSRLSISQAKQIMAEVSDVAKDYDYLGDLDQDIGSQINDADLKAPLVFLGRGGSGTRILSEIAQSMDVFLGNRLNKSKDSVEWVDTIYEIGSRRTVPNKGYQLEESKAVDLLHHRARDVLSAGDWQEGRPWGWKLPETMLIVPDVLRAFPKARFVHLVRHPVTSSLRRTHMTSRADNPIGHSVLLASYREAGLDVSRIHTDEDYLRNAYSWLYQVKRVHEFAMENLDSKTYFLLRYEDVLQSSKSYEQDLSNFTGLAYEKSDGLSLSSARAKYHEENDPRIAEVWSICGQFAKSLGYGAEHDCK